METDLEFSEIEAKCLNYPNGYFLRDEQDQLNFLFPQLHGYFLVQLGVDTNYDLKTPSPIMKHVYVGTAQSDQNTQCSVVSSYNELPFQSESVDVFFLPHTFEQTSQPHKLLSEIYNILIPGGKLIVLGFNPCSLWGLTHFVKSAKNHSEHEKLYTLSKLRSWLNNQGFSLEYQKRFCFRPPLKNKRLFERLKFLEKVGEVCFPIFGSVYIVVAEKKMSLVPPLKMKVVSQKIPVTRGFPEPSTHKGL